MIIQKQPKIKVEEEEEERGAEGGVGRKNTLYPTSLMSSDGLCVFQHAHTK